MLRHLRVTNFSILSDVTLEFAGGMNVLTGETGAGKSLIVEAVNLLRGGRASADIPRAGADEAVVEAVVEVPSDLRVLIKTRLLDAGLPLEADGQEVLIRRVIQRGGRSRVYINGALSTAGRLAEIGAVLIDLSGQHQHQGLVDANTHRELLDAYARLRDKKAETAQRAWHTAWSELAATRAELADLEGDEATRLARLDVARFLYEELSAATPTAGEDVTLEHERARLASMDQLLASARHAEAALYSEENSATDRLAIGLRELERIGRIDPTLAPAQAALNEARALIDDAAGQLRRYVGGLDADPGRLAEINDRLALLRRLVRKHGCDTAGLVAKQEDLGHELAREDNRDIRLAELRKALTNGLARAQDAAATLTSLRKKAAAALAKAVGASLAELGMSDNAIAVDVRPGELAGHGADTVEILLAANKGEAARPLGKVASGGELSRIMLALKLALRQAEAVATYVFDEVDAGIGGVAAQAVGRQIAAVAEERQVICVTHLPQIAAFADHHFHVAKSESRGRTETHVSELLGAERKAELARMLSGSTSPKALAHAAELLSATRAAGKPRPSA